MLDGAVRRPRMYGGSDFGVELVFRNLLADLCFIDEREKELDRAFKSLSERGHFLATGLLGGLGSRIQDVPDLSHEIASVYAEIAARLGFLSLQRRLSSSEWRLLRRGLRSRCRERDWRATQVRATFGEPSLVSDSVYCYAPQDLEAGWVFFDFCSPSDDCVTSRAHILRDVRLPAVSLAREFTFTPHGLQHKRKL